VAEWLRRWIANPLLFERVSSNLTVVVFKIFDFYLGHSGVPLDAGDMTGTLFVLSRLQQSVSQSVDGGD
jgi:hypothetical protein